MQRKFLVISTWIDKKTGQPKSSIGEISEGTNKDGKTYQITATDRTTVIDGSYPVGTLINGTMTLTPDMTASKNFTAPTASANK
jgi:hypothetical protein